MLPVERLAARLDATELQRAARFHFDAHRRRYVAAHGQMRALLAAYTGGPSQALRFALEARGKPLLARDEGVATPHMGFNLSHAEDQGLLAVARVDAVGADIEVRRHLNDLDSLAESHFTPTELRDLRRLPDEHRHDGFFAAWTRKEAYVKAHGAGLSVALDSFEVTLLPSDVPALRSIDGSEAEARNWTLWASQPTPASWAAVAVRIPAARVHSFSLRPSDSL